VAFRHINAANVHNGQLPQAGADGAHLVAVFCAHDLEGHSRARGKGWHKGLAPLDTAGLDGLAAQQEGIACEHDWVKKSLQMAPQFGAN